jgi:Ca-activated chloride channel homolog
MNYEFDPYAVLGITSSATIDDINRAYSKLEHRIQPNANQYATTARSQLTVIKAAYDILANPNQRRQYDNQVNRNDKDDKSDLYFSMRVTSSKRTIIPLPEDQIIYLLADIIASPASRKLEEREANLNLTLVLDHSKSMEDENRMEKVKKAAQTIITELTSDDVVSIVAFNDWSSVIIEANPVHDKMSMRGRISMIQPRGGTEIYKGLAEGVKQNRKYLKPSMINHIILLTDGRTFGDREQCLALARQVASEGITISAMGLGSDWNDQFLDELASVTGGTSSFINSVDDVSTFLDDKIRNLSNGFAERMQMEIVPETGVQLEMAFQLLPSPQPLKHDEGIIHLSGLQPKRPISVLMQFQLPANMPVGTTSVARLMASGNIMPRNAQKHIAIGELEIEVTKNPKQTEAPPATIIDALSKLTLYQIQEKAQAALDAGDVAMATKHLHFLGTRLIDMGEVELGRQALAEAQHISQTRAFSNDASGKTIKYSTRALIQTGALKDQLTALFKDDDDDDKDKDKILA